MNEYFLSLVFAAQILGEFGEKKKTIRFTFIP